jgi:hypothetical protein
MKGILKLAGIAAACVVASAVLMPAQAFCSGNFLLTQNGSDGTYTYVVTPGQGVFEGNFWALNNGIPGAGTGHDSGALPPAGWMVFGAGPGGWYIAGDWGTPGVDGCVNEPPVVQPGETVATFHDTSADGLQGYYAVACVEENITANYNFNDELGGVDIVLAPIPRPVIVTASSGAGTATVTLNIEAVGPGVYRDAGECTTDQLVTSYQIFSRTAGSDANSRNPGGWTPLSAVTPVGQNTASHGITCNPGEVVFLATQLTYDSGFVSPILSASKTGLSCSSTVADPPSKFKIIKKPARTQLNNN